MTLIQSREENKDQIRGKAKEGKNKEKITEDIIFFSWSN